MTGSKLMQEVEKDRTALDVFLPELDYKVILTVRCSGNQENDLI
jgi:hypothetical protein